MIPEAGITLCENEQPESSQHLAMMQGRRSIGLAGRRPT